MSREEMMKTGLRRSWCQASDHRERARSRGPETPGPAVFSMPSMLSASSSARSMGPPRPVGETASFGRGPTGS